MTENKDKVSSEDLDIPQPVNQDPELHKEEVRIQIKLMRLNYYKEVAKTIGFFLSTFKAEAVSLVSGVATLVMGYYQLKHWVLKEKKDNARSGLTLGSGEGVGHGLGRASEARVTYHPMSRTVVAHVEIPVNQVYAEESFKNDPQFYSFLLSALIFGVVSTNIGMKKFKSMSQRRSSSEEQ